MRPRCLHALLLLVALPPASLEAQRGDTLRVALIMPARHSASTHAQSIVRGLELGMEEAARTAALFGVVIEVMTSDTMSATSHEVEQMLVRRASAAVIADERCSALDRIAARRQIVVFAIACSRDDAWQEDSCVRTVFLLVPTEATRARMRSILGRDAHRVAPDDARVVTWHHTLKRFGAEQLNERFRRRFDADMDSPAWTAWLAVKMLGETALRARSTKGPEMARYLRRPDTRFDGHKGEPLTFEQRTGELRQTLYLVAGGAGEEQPAAEVSAVKLWSGATLPRDACSNGTRSRTP